MAEPNTDGADAKADGGDAAEKQRAGTQTDDGRNAGIGTITKEEALAWKAKAERVNQLEAELAAKNAELEERVEPEPAAPDVTSDPRAAAVQRMYTDAREGNPYAIAWVLAREEQQEVVRESGHMHQLDRIKDDAEREEARKHFQSNRHRLGDPRAALAEVREKKLEARTRELEAENAKLKRQPDPEVMRAVETDIREQTASGKTLTMTRKEWDRRESTLSMPERMALKRAKREGKVEVVD